MGLGSPCLFVVRTEQTADTVEVGVFYMRLGCGFLPDVELYFCGEMAKMQDGGVDMADLLLVKL